MFRCAALSTSFSIAGADLFRAAGLSACIQRRANKLLLCGTKYRFEAII